MNSSGNSDPPSVPRLEVPVVVAGEQASHATRLRVERDATDRLRLVPAHSGDAWEMNSNNSSSSVNRTPHGLWTTTIVAQAADNRNGAIVSWIPTTTATDSSNCNNAATPQTQTFAVDVSEAIPEGHRIISGQVSDSIRQLQLVTHRGGILVVPVPANAGNIQNSIVRYYDVARLCDEQQVLDHDGIGGGGAYAHSMLLLPSMVVHYCHSDDNTNSNSILLGWNPHLLAIDPSNGRVTVWASDASSSNSNNNGESETSWFGLRRTPHKAPRRRAASPVAALAVCANNGNNNNGIVFSLHNDGAVQLWTSPTQARVIASKNTASILPPPETWNATHPIHMTAALYNRGQVYALAIAVPTTTTTTSSSPQQQHPMGSLAVWSGTVDAPTPAAPEDPAFAAQLQHLPVLPTNQQQRQQQSNSTTNNNNMDSCWIQSVAWSPGTAGLDVRWTDGRTVHYPHGMVRLVEPQPAHTTPPLLQTTTYQPLRQLVAHWNHATTCAIQGKKDAASLEEALHAVDAAWLDHLRALPVSVGLVERVLGTPSGSSSNHNISTTSRTTSREQHIALAAIQGLHIQRNAPPPAVRRRTPTQSRRPPPGGPSLYDSLVQTEAGDESATTTTMMMIVDDNDNANENDQDKLARAIQEHQDRWRTLLLGILDELENVANTSCCLGHTNEGQLVLVRSPGTVTVQCIPSSSSSSSGASSSSPLWNLVDEIGANLLRALETSTSDNDDDNAALFVQAQHELYASVASTRVVWTEGTATNLVQSKIMPVVGEHFWEDTVMPTPGAAEQLVQDLRSADEDGIVAELLAPPQSRTLPGLGSLADAATESSLSVSAPPANVGPTVALVRTCLQSARQLTLGRLLVLWALPGASPRVKGAALHAHLYTLSLVWASQQKVNLPLNLKQWRETNETEDTLAASKRRLFGGVPEAAAQKNLLEASIQALTEAPTIRRSEHLTDSTVAWATAFWYKAYGGWNHPNAVASHPLELPDLSILPPSKKLQHPRIALRLLAPAMTCQVNAINAKERTKLLADALLMEAARSVGSLHYPDMTGRAFALLRFTGLEDAALGMQHLDILSKHAQENPRLVDKFLSAVEDALMDVQGSPSLGLQPSAGPIAEYHTTMWNMLFEAAISGRKWEKAYGACLKNPIQDRRLWYTQRLVRSMVDAGHLKALLDLVSTTSQESEGMRVQTFRAGGDLYGVAVDALEQQAHRDLYHLQVVNQSETFVDYPGALFALHADRGEWRRAAQALDLRYVYARKALSEAPKNCGLGPGQLLERERLIVDDMVTAATTCVDVILNVKDPGLRFIVSGEYGAVPNLPISLQSQTSEGSPSSGRQLTVAKSEPFASSRRERYTNEIHLRTRAIRCRALSHIFINDQEGSYELAKAALLEEVTAETTDQAIIDRLFAIGCYPEGLALATAVDEGKSSGTANLSLFADSLSHLLCEFLLPIATGTSNHSFQPTFSQLQAAMDSLGCSPCILSSTSYKKLSLLEGTKIRDAAMALVRHYVVVFTTDQYPFAVEVASQLIDVTQGNQPLPPWLEDLLIYGTQRMDKPGLFHKRPFQSDSAAFLGNPSSLLSLYTERGLLIDATRIVSTVLDVESRRASSSNRLPEKGNIDCVPYNKIDFLYNLIGVMAEKHEVAQDDRDELHSAQNSLVHNLEEHFELLKISEGGLRSARMVS